MAVVGTALQTDINWVVKSFNDSNYTYQVEIHCGTRNIQPLKVVSIDGIRDFIENYADEIVLEAIFIQQDYDLYVFPNRDQLLVTVIRKPIGTVSDSVQLNRPAYAKTYRATLNAAESQALKNGDGYVAPTDNYSAQALLRTRLQLIDRAVEQMRITPTGNIYRKTIPAAALLTELTVRSTALNLDVADKPKGVQMVAGDNTTPRNHVIIPHGIPLPNLAHHIHEKEGGIYKTGIGQYYHNNTWWIYPPYDVSRFPKEKQTLTIFMVRSMELPASDNTYRVDDGAVSIIANGKTSHIDPTDHQAANQGNGVRFAKATDLMDNFAQVAKGAVTAVANDVMGGFVGALRDSKMENVPFSNTRITDNIWHESSKVSERMGQRLQLNWDRCDPSLITPGMPCRILYENNGLLFELMGTVLNTQYQVRMDTPGMTGTRYITGAGLTLFAAVTKTTKA